MCYIQQFISQYYKKILPLEPEVQNLPPKRRVCSLGEILEKSPHLGKVVNQEVLA